MINQIELRAIYRKYGFDEKKTSYNGIFVFTLKSGHFHNADIVVLNNASNKEDVFEEFKKVGYACKFRFYESINDARQQLFNGFFSVESTRDRLKREYKSFTNSIISTYPDNASYDYINTSYFINGKEGELSVSHEVLCRLNKNEPTLFIVEAAAGFGKTCTAYEILSEILNTFPEKVPLFTELSRNRQAKIFRYVLLDEIDRTFPSLSSSLVQDEIINGNIITILDGFDELLHRSENNDGYDNSEPMLETIGQLLKNKAKVILTTRRTSIFDGDEFHNWLDSHNEHFSVIRLKINEPCINDWLPEKRLASLAKSGFPIRSLANPVLLSYLRCINDLEFNKIEEEPNKIAEQYFSSMLNREMTRQDLHLNEDQQYMILKSLAKDMMDSNYKTESREYFLEFILDKYSDLLEETRNTYSVDEKPTKDELANKLASHAFLDRDRNEGSVIGFVNDFVLGSFCAELILEDESNDWLGDEVFIAPAVLAFVPKTYSIRNKLYLALKFSLEFIDAKERINLIVNLTNSLDIELDGASVNSMLIEHVNISETMHIKNTIFMQCTFKDVKLNLNNFDNTTFVSCTFYNSSILNTIKNKGFYTIDCKYDPNSESLKRAMIGDDEDKNNEAASDNNECEKYLLDKFLPIGRPTGYKHRPLTILLSTNDFSHKKIFKTIRKLKQLGIFNVADMAGFVELNMDSMNKIKRMLNR